MLLLAPLVAISAKRNSAGTATGNRTQADWLLAGELLHPIYSLHLLAGATIVIALVLHVLMGLKVAESHCCYQLLIGTFDRIVRSNAGSSRSQCQALSSSPAAILWKLGEANRAPIL